MKIPNLRPPHKQTHTYYMCTYTYEHICIHKHVKMKKISWKLLSEVFNGERERYKRKYKYTCNRYRFLN